MKIVLLFLKYEKNEPVECREKKESWKKIMHISFLPRLTLHIARHPRIFFSPSCWQQLSLEIVFYDEFI